MRYAHELLFLLACLSLLLLTRPVGAQAYTVTLSVQGLPAGLATALKVDAIQNGTLVAGKSVTFNFTTGSTHVISVDPSIPGEKGVRYFANSASWNFSGSGTHTFTYSTQYLLTVQTAYSSATGSGWYDAGSIVQAVMKDSQVDEGQGTRVIFKGWMSDASGSNRTSNKIVLDAPKAAIASWKTQFLLTVNSDPSSVSNLRGAGWYDSGTQAVFSSASVINTAEGTRLRFSAWTGDYSGESSNGTIIVDRPKFVTAHFQTQYLITVQYDPPSILSRYNETRAGWYDVGATALLGPVPPLVEVSSAERLKFLNWVDNGQMVADYSLRVASDRPHRVALSYATQYYVDVKTSHGSVSGSGWYEKGATAKITEVSDAGWPVSYTFAGWNLNPSGRLVRGDNSWSLTVDRPYVVEAEWSVNYFPLTALVGGSIAAVLMLLASVVMLIRRRTRNPPKISSKGQFCKSCGSIIPEGGTFCQKCGAPITPVGRFDASIEGRVYDYILKHEGVISLSQAANDLGITIDQVKETAEKLKADGKLS